MGDGKTGIMRKFLKDWMLVIAMALGASLYLVYHAIAPLHFAGTFLLGACRLVQPVLLFCMLFLSFVKISPSDMKLRKWQWCLLAVQALSFVLLCLLLWWALKSDSAFALWACNHRIAIESAMLCLICPTATACAVVTGKLGGSMAGVVTYTVMINLLVAVLVPLCVPMIYPVGGMSFGEIFLRILEKVFPMLVLPCILAWIIRFFLPKVQIFLLKYSHVSFYIWAVSLTLAILMSTRELVCSGAGAGILWQIAIVTGVCCFFQFHLGKKIGGRWDDKITAGQALGQKNTVFAIWLGYSFFDPATAVSGGFYSLWHNSFNTWQLRKVKK